MFVITKGHNGALCLRQVAEGVRTRVRVRVRVRVRFRMLEPTRPEPMHAIDGAHGRQGVQCVLSPTHCALRMPHVMRC